MIFVVFITVFNNIQAQDVNKYAVVVGCADYQMQGLDLRYSDDDAYRYYAYLLSCEGGAIPAENISILVDEAATKQNIIKTMNDVYSKAGPEDMLIFYFSGHGSEGAFCPDDVLLGCGFINQDGNIFGWNCTAFTAQQIGVIAIGVIVRITKIKTLHLVIGTTNHHGVFVNILAVNSIPGKRHQRNC